MPFLKSSRSWFFIITYLIVIQTASSTVNKIFQTIDLNTSRTLCRELFSTSLSIECFYNGNTTSCDDPMLNGTTATLKCKHSYHLDVMPFDEMHCLNGQWNRPLPLFNCEPICGIKTSKSTPYVARKQDADIGDFPWHASLFLRMEGKYQYICGGSILSPKLIITAAHCLLNPDLRLYRVAAGKIHREWHHKKDKNAQYRDVVNMIVDENNTVESTESAADIAVLVLNQVFVLSDLIRPICLDFDSTPLDFHENNLAHIPGWEYTTEDGDQSDILQYVSLPLLDHDTCLKIIPDQYASLVTLDKICAGYTNGTSLCIRDDGGGLILPRKFNDTVTQYYLIGIVSSGPRKDETCDSRTYSIFTTVSNFIKFINETKSKYESWSPYDYGCVLPELPPDGAYTVDADIPEGRELLPGSLVPHYTKLKYACDPGYGLQGSEIVTCKEKIWNVNNFIPACFKTCPKLNSTELDIEYTSASPFENEVLHETQAIFQCSDSNYEIQEPLYNQTTCRDGGWTRSLPKCVPLCGISTYTENVDLNTTRIGYPGEQPWHVGIFFSTNDTYILVCSGTILSPFFVATDGACVERKHLDQYRIVAGSVSKSFNSSFEEHAQTASIYKIHSYFAIDVLVLKKRFNITPFVRPACFPHQKLNFSEEQLTFQTSVWTKEDDNLKILKYTANADLFNTLKNQINVTVDGGVKGLGGIFLPLKKNSETRQFFMGIGLEIFENVPNLYVLLPSDFKFVRNLLDEEKEESDVTDECTVPTTPNYLQLVNYKYRPGELVSGGTTIKYACSNFSQLYNNNEITCKNSEWVLSPRAAKCVGCGTSLMTVSPNRTNSKKYRFHTKPENFPWYARIYEKKNPVSQICSGTIISSKLILTDTLCLKEEFNTSFKNDVKYSVTVGNYHWNTSLDEYAQHVDVEEVAFIGSYIQVAILILQTDLTINEHVLPACVDLLKITNYSPPVVHSIMPYGHIMGKQNNKTNMNFLYFSKPLSIFWDTLFVYENESIHCPMNRYWDSFRGSALVFKSETEFGDRYFIHGIFRYSDCRFKRLYFLNLRPFINWLNEMLEIYM